MKKPLTFTELFAGIGGFRLGLERPGKYECVWSNEKDKYAAQVYTNHFGGDEFLHDDIRNVDVSRIPDHDLLTQNRERIFIVGHLGKGRIGQVFPLRRENTAINQAGVTSTV